MKALEKIQNQLDQNFEKLDEYLSSLSLRERIMVIAATIIVVVALIGAALFKMHQAADDQQKRLNELKDTLVWMQSNVVTMKSSTDMSLSASEKIQRVAQQTGISVTSQPSENKIQIVVEHENYSVLANFLTQLVQMGLSVEKLELIKIGPAIKLTALVQ
jgi:type II secretory pathway component PulM